MTVTHLASAITFWSLLVPGLSAPSPYPLYTLSTRSTGTAYNASLPNVTIYATGGTIAGSANSSAQITGYGEGAIDVNMLIAAVPELTSVANVRGVQVANVASESITSDLLLNMSRSIQAELDVGLTQGIVVTHGTDTLEESAFFLQLAIDSTRPVVVVGAMRPATAISADGPINLLEAVTLAGSESAEGRGTMIVLNDRIASSWYTTKTNANTLDTFKSNEAGFLGVFMNAKPIFYYQTSKPVGNAYFDISSAGALPQVDVLYGYEDLNVNLATAAVESGAQGIVLAGMGAGGWTDEGTMVLKGLAANGTKVVVSRRTMDGYVEPQSTRGIYGGGFLNPQKARIMLQMALYTGYEEEEMRGLFEYDGN